MSSSSSSLPYYGTTKCQAIYASGKNKGNSCDSNAYYIDNNKYLCGRHTKSRECLPKKSTKEVKQEEEQLQNTRENLIEEFKINNIKNNKKGDVILYKMRMRQKVVHKDGYLCVFPNFKHENRANGLGLKSLSPMLLGPVDTKQKNVPIAKNLENAWQQSKQFGDESDEDFLTSQIEGFNDDTPHRHKRKMEKGLSVSWIWCDPTTNKRHKLDWITARQFYCNWYERLVTDTEDWKYLRKLVDEGTNVQLCGYDGNPINGSSEIEDAYLSTSAPFGHERVLYAMLLMDEKDYPWRKHKTFEF